jgi:hypothetical protein
VARAGYAFDAWVAYMPLTFITQIHAAPSGAVFFW